MSDKQEKQSVEIYKRIDYSIIIATIFIVAFGLLILYSSIENMDGLKSQAGYVVAGIFVMLGVQFVPYKVIAVFKGWWYLFSFGALALLMVPSLKSEALGATRWIVIAGITIQITEVVKAFMIFFLAYYLSTHVIEVQKPEGVFRVWLMVGVASAAVLLIGSNLSSCLILLMITFSMTFILSKVNWLHGAAIAVVVIAVLALCTYYLNHLPTQDELVEIERKSYQLARVIAWLAPENYTGNNSFQVLQGLYAIGSGGFWGKGLGESAQRRILPEVQNDMIVCVLAEELGIFGVVLLVILYLYLLYHIYLVAKKTKNMFGKLLCMGILFYFSFQVLINMAVATGSIPNTGVALPFVSSGGTSTLINFGLVGLVLSVYKHEMNPLSERDLKKIRQN